MSKWEVKDVAEFAQSLASALYDVYSSEHGINLCCSLDMMYRAMAKIDLIRLKNDDAFDWDINNEFWNG